ncbi:conserved hypothetical protein [Hyella patelloides LEGE 07179]|uniref:Uncharacterized protein n=1 Tax=Hyella patelloides LEGE 07179 TaxID=945734 RepID=A0A563VP83_9CYAN|nr:hypothetical protein [Hyella patelloides]VEP13282.1 conserved hypothetical protein [Hyella patelloides LEGE 07179]
MESNQNNNLDELLSDLKSQYNASNTTEKSQNNDKIEDLLNEVKSQLKPNNISAKAKNNQVTSNNPQVNEYLDSLKAQYRNQQSHQQAQKDLIYNRNQQEIIVQEQQKQLKHKQLIRQAEKWLANLDPTSDEGMWFNQLAESYPSKLDAAISYLSTLDQSGF